ncbi:MAG: hypothetical protein MI725_06960, partial [Pirellulales bacterium]|nr:hypothetical protein [Pirellulales bacterium]
VPISVLGSHVDLRQTHDVNVASGAMLRTARDANLTAEQLATAEITSYGTGRNWLSAVASGIDSLFGSDGVSEELQGGTTNNIRTTAVTVNGTVEVGIQKNQTLVIDRGANPADEDGIISITQNDGNIGVTTSIESVAANLASQRQQLQDLIQAYSGDPESIAAYQADLTRVEQQMTDLGLISTVAGDTFIDESYSSHFVTLDNIHAQSGTINVNAATLAGTGTLLAPGNVSVTITNNSPAYLRLNEIVIPDHAGGRVRLNSVDVTSAADVNTFTGTITTAGDSAQPTITIASNFDEDAPQNQVAPWNTFLTPDVEISGDIENLLGSVTITSEGSILSRANINASTLSLTAGRDFVLTAGQSLFHTGGDPGGASSPWAGIQTDAETAGESLAGSIPGFELTFNNSSILGGVTTTEVANALAASPQSNIIAANNVLISAQEINVNGIVQSGIADHNVTIAPTITSQITAAESAHSLHAAGYTSLAAITATVAGIQTDDYVYFELNTGGSDTVVDPETGLEYFEQVNSQNIPVFYNAQEDRMELSGVRVQGGYMSLTGQILSTGGGELRVLDGYGRINVDNQTTVPLLINRLDTSTGIEGRLEIVDFGDTNSQGQPRVTVYTRPSADIEVDEYYMTDPGQTPTLIAEQTLSSTRTTTYTPHSTDVRYFWTTGRDLTQSTTTTYGQSSWLGIDSFAPDPSDITDGPHTTFANPRPLREGAYTEDSLPAGLNNSSDYTYEFDRIDLAPEQTEVVDQWQTSTWYGTTTYFVKQRTWQDQKDIHTHSIKADRPIDINFIGYDEGSAQATVESDGDVLVNGNVQNPDGNTQITAGGTIRQVNEDASVGGRNITFSAGTGIGDDTVVRTNLADAQTGVVNAQSTTGSIQLFEVAGDLKVDQVTTATNNGDVLISAQQDLLTLDNDSVIRGGFVTLASRAGAVGDVDGMAILVDTGTNERDGLLVTSLGEVNVEELAGDLRLQRIDTNGGLDVESIDQTGTSFDVRLKVRSGTLIDANITEVQDPRTVAELLALYDRMLATEDTAQQAIDATVRAFENTKTGEYHTYWKYRNTQADPSVYDSTFQVSLSASERTAYTAFYTQLGTDDGLTGTALNQFVQDAITALEGKRTAEYHTLHRTWGDVGNIATAATYDANVYDANFRYESTGVSSTFTLTDVDNAADTIDMEDHGFVNLQSVVYHHGGASSIGGLTDGATYFVVSEFRAFQSTTVNNSTNKIDLGAGHGLSTGDEVIYHFDDQDVSTNTAIGGLADGATYTVTVDSDNMNLVSLADADGNSVDLDATGAATSGHRFDLVDFDKFHLAASYADATADTPVTVALDPSTGDASGHYFSDPLHTPFAASDVSGNDITVGVNAFTDGQSVVYRTGGGTAIGGLTDGGVYYVVKTGATTVQLAGSQESRSFQPGDDVTNNEIAIGTHTFQDGQAVVYRAGGGSAVGGLIDGETYYVRATGATTGSIRLASTQADAVAGANLLTLSAAAATGTAHSVTGSGDIVTLDTSVATGSRHSIAEAGVLGQRAAWSESQLQNSVSASILRPSSNSGTTTTTEEANIVGNDINLIVVGGSIGSVAGTLDINLSTLDTLSEAQRLALASAEPDDVTFYSDAAGTVEIEPDDQNATAVLIRINLTEDIDIAAMGTVSANSDNNLFLGSEADIHIDLLQADSEARLKGQQNIADGNPGVAGWVNVVSDNLVLEGETGSIGTATDPIVINLGLNALLTARALNEIYVVEDTTTIDAMDDGNLNVRSANASTLVSLVSLDGSILDGDDTGNWNVLTATLQLTAAGGIGSAANFFDTEVATAIQATAPQNIYLNEVNQEATDGGIMPVDLIQSTSGNVELRAWESIVAINTGDGTGGKSLADVIGNAITLNAGLSAFSGTIGRFDDDLQIDTSSTGLLTTSSVQSAHLVEMIGDLNLNTITVANSGETAFIAAPSGNIINGAATGDN